ncbi:hypothetical protein PRIC1_011656 [Phytophthora ramorum]
MHLRFLLVVVLVVLAANCHGLSMKKIDGNSHVQIRSIPHGTRVNLEQINPRAEAEERGEVHNVDLSTFRLRDLRSTDTTSAAKPMDVQKEERGPSPSVLKTFAQKDKNSPFNRLKGLLGKNPTKLTQKNVDDLKKKSKLKGLLSKKPSTLNKESAGILRGYLAKNGMKRVYIDAVMTAFGVSALAVLIYALATSAPK